MNWLNATNDVDDKAAQTTCFIATLLQRNLDIDDVLISLFIGQKKKKKTQAMHEKPTGFKRNLKKPCSYHKPQ